MNEFENIKYKRLYNSLNKNEIFYYDKKFFNKNKLDILLKNKIVRMSLKNYLDTNLCILKKYITLKKISTDNLVEIGCGYGSNLIRLSLDKNLHFKNFIGIDLSKSGLKIIESINPKIRLINKDFYKMTKGAIFKNSSTIITNCFMMYKQHSDSSIKKILNLNTKYVVCLEPMYELNKGKKYYEKLVRKYILLNDYSTNIFSKIKLLEKKGLIRILELKKNIFSHNPFLPLSLVIFKKI